MTYSKFLTNLLLVLLTSSVAAQDATECMIYTEANIIATTQKGGAMAPYLAFQANYDTLCNTTTWACHLGQDYDTAAGAICDAHGGEKHYEDIEICDTFLNLLQIDTGGIVPIFKDVPICLAPSPHCAAGTTHQDMMDAMNACTPLPALPAMENPTRRLADGSPQFPKISLTGPPPGMVLP